MHITLADLEGMASPGWGGSAVEIPDLLDDLDGEAKDDPSSESEDYEEIGCKKAVPEEKPEAGEQGKKRFSYGEDGRREGLSTLEMCNHCSANRMLRKDLLEQEFFAIRKIYPANGADLKILIWLAAGRSYQETGELVGRSCRTIKNAVQRLRQFRQTGKVRLLPAAQVQTVEDLDKPFPKSRAGRKPKQKITAAIVDLFGEPVEIMARKAKARRQAGVRRPRVRRVCEGQMELFDMAA